MYSEKVLCGNVIVPFTFIANSGQIADHLGYQEAHQLSECQPIPQEKRVKHLSSVHLDAIFNIKLKKDFDLEVDKELIMQVKVKEFTSLFLCTCWEVVGYHSYYNRYFRIMSLGLKPKFGFKSWFSKY